MPIGVVLDDLERDALAELGNIGIAKASTALSRMVGGPVEISVPSVGLLPLGQVASVLTAAFTGPLIGIGERLDGALHGTALLVIPQTASLPLVRASLPPDIDEAEAVELEDEALGEIGNVVLNSGIAQIANLLGADIQTALPVVRRGDAAGVLAASGLGPEVVEPAILFHIAFRLADPGVGGRVVLGLDAGSSQALKRVIGGYIGRILS